jgi:hypothetical protein
LGPSTPQTIICALGSPAQHVHQRDGAALADVAAGRAEVRLAGGVQRLLEPGRGRARSSRWRRRRAVEGDLGLVGRVVFQQGFSSCTLAASTSGGRRRLSLKAV